MIHFHLIKITKESIDLLKTQTVIRLKENKLLLIPIHPGIKKSISNIFSSVYQINIVSTGFEFFVPKIKQRYSFSSSRKRNAKLQYVLPLPVIIATLSLGSFCASSVLRSFQLNNLTKSLS